MKKYMIGSFILSILFLFGCNNVRNQNADWIKLFDGETLNGWSVHSGFAKYRVEDGTIVGTAVKGSPNSTLR